MLFMSGPVARNSSSVPNLCVCVLPVRCALRPKVCHVVQSYRQSLSTWRQMLPESAPHDMPRLKCGHAP